MTADYVDLQSTDNSFFLITNKTPISFMAHEYVVGTIISLMALEPVLFTKQGTKCWYDSQLYCHLFV